MFWHQSGGMNNTNHSTDASSFKDQLDLNAWHQGLRQPSGGNPLQEPIMAAVYGYRFNNSFWRLNDEGDPEPVLEPRLGRWEQLNDPGDG